MCLVLGSNSSKGKLQSSEGVRASIVRGITMGLRRGFEFDVNGRAKGLLGIGNKCKLKFAARRCHVTT